jgi:ribonuclease HI
VVASKKKKT